MFLAQSLNKAQPLRKPGMTTVSTCAYVHCFVQKFSSRLWVSGYMCVCVRKFTLWRVGWSCFDVMGAIFKLLVTNSLAPETPGSIYAYSLAELLSYHGANLHTPELPSCLACSSSMLSPVRYVLFFPSLCDNSTGLDPL